MSIKTPDDRVVYSSPFINAKITFNPSLGQHLDNTFGLFGPVQKYIDQEFSNQIKAYMPFKTGTLQNLMIMNTVIGSGENVTRSPAARFLYYGMLMVDSVTGSAWALPGGTKVLTDIPLEYHGGGHSGPKWDERWAAANLKGFVESVQRFVDGGNR